MSDDVRFPKKILLISMNWGLLFCQKVNFTKCTYTSHVWQLSSIRLMYIPGTCSISFAFSTGQRNTTGFKILTVLLHLTCGRESWRKSW